MMSQADLAAAWQAAEAATSDLVGQPVVWKGQTIQAVGDGFLASSRLASIGGGMMEDFAGQILFLKSQFANGAGPFPQIGDKVTVGTGSLARDIRLAGLAGETDSVDPFLAFAYTPTAK